MNCLTLIRKIYNSSNLISISCMVYFITTYTQYTNKFWRISWFNHCLFYMEMYAWGYGLVSVTKYWSHIFKVSRNLVYCTRVSFHRHLFVKLALFNISDYANYTWTLSGHVTYLSQLAIRHLFVFGGLIVHIFLNKYGVE